jgi:hypothetical protein
VNILTQFVALLEGMNQIAGFSKMACLVTWKKQQLSHMIALSGTDFGYYDPPTSFCGAF